MTYPSGFATRQVYNAQGHLSEVQNGANPATLYWRALQVNARGQVTQEALGNGIVTERAFEAETGLIQGITSTFGSSGDVQNLGFTFDLIGNLTERRDKRFSTHFIEGFGYDTLNRMETVSTTGSAAVTAAYNDLGNITSRSDVGTFNYAASGPHALSSVTGSSGGALNKTCGYDAKGNRTSDGGTVLDYSSFNKPTRIRKGGDTLSFDYGPDRALYRQTIFHTSGTGATSQTVREYIGGLYEREITSEGLVRHIHHIAGGNGVVAIHTDERSAASAAQRTRFIHKDHLGSVDAITDSNGAVVERQSYDAWGRRRAVTHNAGTWTVTYLATPGSAETHRGFTGHEMLDLVVLVHMGGRIYDPITARFLSPDPFVQSPDNLQNLNRYSYVLNNPLSYTDPSGFFFKALAKLFQKVAPVLRVVATVLSVFPATRPIGMALNAVISFGSAFSGTLLAGGSVGDALRAGLVANIKSSIAGAISNQIGGGLVGRAIVNGVQEQVEGGKFKHGFFAAIRSGITNAGISGGVRIAGNLVLPDALGSRSGSLGGTFSQTGGGKFSNGAATPAMSNTLGDVPADISFDDITHTVGALVNLPLALPVWAAGQLFPETVGRSLLFKDTQTLGGTRFGTGDHTGIGGALFGNNIAGGNYGDAPGLAGVSMMLVHYEGAWGNTAMFEAGQLSHDQNTGPAGSDSWKSIKDTVGQFGGILVKNAGGSGLIRYVGPGDGYGLTSGFRSGLTPNRPNYSELGNNGNVRW